MMETGLQSLAAEAIGVSGPIGKIAEGMLKFGGGSGLILGAAAGIGAIALAYNALTKESREAEEAQRKLREEIVKTAAARAEAKVPESQRIGRDVTTSTDELARLNAERRAQVQFLTETNRLQGGMAGSLADWLATDAKILTIDAAIADYSLAHAQNRRASASATDDERKKAEQLLETEKKRLEVERERALEAKLAGIISTQTDIGLYRSELQRRRGGVPGQYAPPSFTSPTFGGFGTDTNDPLRSGRGTTFGRGLILDQFRGQVFGAPIRAVQGGVKPDIQAKDWLKSGEIIAQGFFQAVTAFKAGGPGGLFGGVGALASAGAGVQGISKGLGSALGIVGFIGSALGGLFSLFDHSAERRQREQMAELTRIRQNTDKRGQPDHISVVVSLNGKEVSAAILGDVMYGIRRAERTNAVPVLPPAGG